MTETWFDVSARINRWLDDDGNEWVRVIVEAGGDGPIRGTTETLYRTQGRTLRQVEHRTLDTCGLADWQWRAALPVVSEARYVLLAHQTRNFNDPSGVVWIDGYDPLLTGEGPGTGAALMRYAARGEHVDHLVGRGLVLDFIERITDIGQSNSLSKVIGVRNYGRPESEGTDYDYW